MIWTLLLIIQAFRYLLCCQCSTIGTRLREEAYQNQFGNSHQTRHNTRTSLSPTIQVAQQNHRPSSWLFFSFLTGTFLLNSCFTREWSVHLRSWSGFRIHSLEEWSNACHWYPRRNGKFVEEATWLLLYWKGGECTEYSSTTRLLSFFSFKRQAAWGLSWN